MIPMKNRGRSKIFTCFKAPLVDEGDCESPCGCDRESPASGDRDGGRKRKKSVRRRVCVVLEDVFLPPLRKCRSENCKRELYRLRSNLSSTSEKLVESVKKINIPTHKLFRDADDFFFGMNPICPHSLFSPSSNSTGRTTTPSSPASEWAAATTNFRSDPLSFSSNSMPITSMGPETIIIKRSNSLDLGHLRRINKVRKPVKRGNNNNSKQCNHRMEMCSLVVCLLALLIWGKVFAILTCTSTWLLFAPDSRGRRCDRAEFSENDVVRVGGGQEKGGQEGMLERNRSRVLDL